VRNQKNGTAGGNAHARRRKDAPKRGRSEIFRENMTNRRRSSEASAGSRDVERLNVNETRNIVPRLADRHAFRFEIMGLLSSTP
jgi:hypothetical protein